MKASELTKAKYYLNTELKDDATEYGGIAYRGETLKEFICDAYELNDTTGIDELEMSEVNDKLISCGIEPIDYQLTNERRQFAVMIGIYFGEQSDDDRLVTISKIVNFANTYDFEMENDDGEWVINTELARDVAMKFAKELAEEVRC